MNQIKDIRQPYCGTDKDCHQNESSFTVRPENEQSNDRSVQELTEKSVTEVVIQCSNSSDLKLSETNLYPNKTITEDAIADENSIRIFNNLLADANETVGFFYNVQPSQLVAQCPTANISNERQTQLDQLSNNYLQFKSQTDPDSQSNKSIMSSQSTRKIFDMLAWLLPIGILLLIFTLTLHFVFYVRDLEPYKSFTEIVCVILSASVIPLSVVFILRMLCDCKHIFGNETDTNGSPTSMYTYTTSQIPTRYDNSSSSRLVRLPIV